MPHQHRRPDRGRTSWLARERFFTFVGDLSLDLRGNLHAIKNSGLAFVLI